MAKKKIEPIELYINKDNKALKRSNTYVYTLSVYEVNPGRFNMIEHKLTESKTYKGLYKFEQIKKGGHKFYKYVELTAAPEEFLTKHKYFKYGD